MSQNIIGETAFKYDKKNIVCSFYNSSPDQFIVLLTCAIEAATSSRAENVYTTYCSELNEIAINKGMTIYEYIIKLNLDADFILKILNIVKTDDELIVKIGIEIYLFVLHIITSTKQYFIKTNKLLPLIEDCNIKQFKMIHNSIDEARLTSQKTRFFFHGSGLENWNNIFQKGLLVPIGEKSKLLVNANAYGSGIYLSSDPCYSLTYCNSKSGNNKVYILAICEVIETAAIKKCGNIYLATDEKSLLLRYIIYFDTKTMKNPKFKEHITQIIECLNSNIKVNERRHKRLSIELEKIKTEVGIIANPLYKASKFITNWEIAISVDSKIESRLVLELLAHNIKSIDLEFIFGANYPFSPPFIRIIKPRITYIPEKIDKCIGTEFDFLDRGGGICTSLFKTNEWLASYPLVKLIIYIQYLILSSDYFKLSTDWEIPYTEKEVLACFDTTIATYSLDEAIEILETK
jgi:ubiquitin-protein ligase